MKIANVCSLILVLGQAGHGVVALEDPANTSVQPFLGAVQTADSQVAAGAAGPVSCFKLFSNTVQAVSGATFRYTERDKGWTWDSTWGASAKQTYKLWCNDCLPQSKNTKTSICKSENTMTYVCVKLLSDAIKVADGASKANWDNSGWNSNAGAEYQY